MNQITYILYSLVVAIFATLIMHASSQPIGGGGGGYGGYGYSYGGYSSGSGGWSSAGSFHK
jgi:hypothetical protein